MAVLFQSFVLIRSPRRKPNLWQLKVQFSRSLSTKPQHPTVKLSSTVTHPPSATASAKIPHDPPPSLIILHGLFGSKQNWKTLAKSFAARLNAPVHALDLRNHGDSPHLAPMTFKTMATDVARYIEEAGLKRVVVMGHSMGAKVAMTLALENHPSISKLVVVDNSPVRVPISKEFRNYLKIMKEVEEAHVEKQSVADAMMKEETPNLSVRQFLLTNLRNDPTTHHYRFRIPLDIIRDHLDDIGSFPFEPPESENEEKGNPRYQKPVFVLSGKKAGYVTERTIPAFKKFFADVTFCELDAGHWVHAEKPKETIDLVSKFILHTNGNHCQK